MGEEEGNDRKEKSTVRKGIDRVNSIFRGAILKLFFKRNFNFFNEK
jgi:hypothetical protein